jgi:hypothetical protein
MPLGLVKPAGREKGDRPQNKEGEKNEVRERAERKPRRPHQQVEREKRDDKSLFPLLSGAAQETGEHGQQRDSRVSYPTSGGDILLLARLRSLHGIRISQGKLLFYGNRFLCYGMFSSRTSLRLRR